MMTILYQIVYGVGGVLAIDSIFQLK